ncbi:hypothetical protein TI39_contig628g00001 [Zymoseptoria brevis]|uniref:Uncharacterized protein n=1 Tax=Zymoseptoria brevis TaxID=1047168 RepID=A0A0F4GGP4_9PEZI|nr:hypothetical protein TI39_contig628g00001 [Zymoseptoria brevis]
MSPRCIKKLYGIPDTPPKAVAGYEHAIYSTGNDPWDQLSLNTFFSTQTDIPKGTYPKSYNIAGAPEPEAEYRGYHRIAPTPRRVRLAITLDWADATEDYIPLAFQRRQCNEFMKLTLQGVSSIYAVGDWGVANNERTCYGPKGDMWGVPWPANCPYVTGVGGTQIKDGADPTDPVSSPEEALDGRNLQTLWNPVWDYLDNTKIDALGFAALALDLPMPQALNTTIHQIYQTGVKTGEYGH